MVQAKAPSSAENSRQALIIAAGELFAENGVSGTLHFNGSWTEWVASKQTGTQNARMVAMPRISTTRLG